MKIDGMDATSNIINIKNVDTNANTSNVGPDKSNQSRSVDEIKVLEKKNIKSPNNHPSEQEKVEMPISEKVVVDAIEKANKAISLANRRFEYAIHDKTKEIMIKVIDKDSNKTVREIPPEKVLDMVAKMWEMAGIIVDEKR